MFLARGGCTGAPRSEGRRQLAGSALGAPREPVQMAGRENTQAFSEVPEVPPFFITRHSRNHSRADGSVLAGDES